jgi:hypothetical protein
MKLDLEHKWIYWFHLLFVAPLLIWIGVSKTTTPTDVFDLLLVLGLVVVVYHFYKIIS